MTAIKTVMIYCDGDQNRYCADEASRDALREVGTATELREILKLDGWHNRGGSDICPDCWGSGYRFTDEDIQND